MKTQSPDTSPEAERIQIELLRSATDAQRFALARSLTRMVTRLAWQAIREARPQASETNVQLTFLTLRYDAEVAERLRTEVSRRRLEMEIAEVLEIMTPVVEVFEQLGVAYHVSGSVAASVYSVGRATADVDLVANLRPEQVHPFVEQLKARYYVDEDAVREALRYHTSFNLIHSTMFFKVDVYVPQLTAFDRQVFQRLQQKRLEAGEDARLFYLASAEDIVLKKLVWYEMGNRVSDQQWKDVLGILKLQATALDLAYLRQWAVDLNVSALLEQALVDAGLVDDAAPSA